jgi:hypothetical protein
MLVPGQVIVLIVMRSGGQVSVRREIVKFSGALVPVVATHSAARASAAFVAALFAHKFSLSWMSKKCITRLRRRVCCRSPASASLATAFSPRQFNALIRNIKAFDWTGATPPLTLPMELTPALICISPDNVCAVR